jgi:mono/diheme cytochrome c family protein
MCGACAVLLAGCERVMRDMYDQPKLGPATASALFRDGLASRPPPPGSVAQAQGDLAVVSSARHGADAVTARLRAEAEAGIPDRPPRALLARGADRYAIHCVPCHGAGGDGDGVVVERGFPAPPSLHVERLVAAPDRHLYDVVTGGWGVMPAAAERIAPADRWAIVAYVRALQLSRRAPVAALPPGLQSALAASAPAMPAQSGASARPAASAPRATPASPSTGASR